MINVTAHRWHGGWELHIDDDPVTQVVHLADAEQQVRDYLDTIDPTTDHSTVDIQIVPEIGTLGTDVRLARLATQAAAVSTAAAARQSRDAVHAMRTAGLTVADVATILGVSKGRVSQLSRTNV